MTTASLGNSIHNEFGSRTGLHGMRLHDQSVMRHVARGGMMELGDRYIAGDWSADALDEVLYELFTSSPRESSVLSSARLFLAAATQALLNRQAGKRAFDIGIRHYDLGNDLFRRMLDESMSYTCAYWADAAHLEQAQEAKLDLLCRKLDLQPGQNVLDIGCGWGNFALHAATRYGVRVTGVTVSREQAALARERCRDLPVEILLMDYREIAGAFDRVVSIEMIEAVGRKNIPAFFGVVDRCLKDGGLFALQAISGNTLTRSSDRRLDQFIVWLLKHIFPNGYLPTRAELATAGNRSLIIEDWHNLAGDYDQTLLAWARRFNDAWPDLKQRYDEAFRRRWNFYLHGCAAAFRAGLVHVYQITYSKAASPRRSIVQR